MTIYFRKTSAFFDPFVTALVAAYSISTMRNAQLNGYASGVRKNENLTLYGKAVSGIELEMEMTQFLDPICRNEWPEHLELYKRPLNEPAKDPTAMATGRMGITWSLFGSAFLSFFETIQGTIRLNHGSDWRNWPNDSQRFAYQIRNAAAHGGKIHFQNPSAPCVQWKGLSYGPNDNGKKVFADIGVVELFLIMEEVDASLR